MPFNPKNVIEILFKEFAHHQDETPFSYEEQKLAIDFRDTLYQCTRSPDFEFEVTTELLDDDSVSSEVGEDDEEQTHDENADQTSCSSQSSWSPSPKMRKEGNPDTIRKAYEYRFRTNNGSTRSWSSVKNRFPSISKQQIERYSMRIKKGGTAEEKYKRIANIVYTRYKEMQAKRMSMHDSDLRRWAIEGNSSRDNQLNNFKASPSWLLRFKKRNRIVSRKITKFVSRKYVVEEANIETTATAFVASVRKYAQDNNLPRKELLNSDQSGFKKEIHSGRTLFDKGERKVECVTQSINATTHSYTIQPTIGCDGSLLSPLFICLQELKGAFPKKKQIFEAPNIKVVAHTSSILTKKHMLQWFEDVYFSNAPDSSVLLLDSWTTYNDQIAIENITPNNKKVTIMRIPAKTTSKAQPLDRFFFRPYKAFVRFISDRILLDNLPIELHQRDNILKLQSLTHNQFSSPRFKNMILYAWYSCGYIEEHPPPFETPLQYCFPRDLGLTDCTLTKTDETPCEEPLFIRCAHCEICLCFTHFFIENHYCSS